MSKNSTSKAVATSKKVSKDSKTSAKASETKKVKITGATPLEQATKPSKAGKIWAIIGAVVVAFLVLAGIAAGISQNSSPADQVWVSEMTLGNPDAQNYFVIYSDMVCPYCVAFENALVENEENLNKYLENNDILLEVRLTDLLYKTHGEDAKHSYYGAVAGYCAKNEGRFWDYYNLAISRVWNTYFKTNGKTGGTQMNALGKDFWIDLGKEIGLGDSFATCVENDEPLEEIEENTIKAAKITQGGVPYFKFNKQIITGFDMNGDWNNVLFFFEQGLKNK